MVMAVAGGADLMDVMGGGFLDQNTQGWLQEQSSNLYATLSSTARAFYDQAVTAHRTVSESQAMQMLRNLKAKIGGVWDSGQIQYLANLENIQTANPYMQRFIMANPVVRQRYLDQTVDGYSETYTNPAGDVIGAEHYDYRRVMDGVLEVNPDDTAEHDFTVTHYYDFMEAGERDLSTHEKLDILGTWDRIQAMLDEGGEDPTCPWGAQL